MAKLVKFWESQGENPRQIDSNRDVFFALDAAVAARNDEAESFGGSGQTSFRSDGSFSDSGSPNSTYESSQGRRSGFPSRSPSGLSSHCRTRTASPSRSRQVGGGSVLSTIKSDDSLFDDPFVVEENTKNSPGSNTHGSSYFLPSWQEEANQRNSLESASSHESTTAFPVSSPVPSYQGSAHTTKRDSIESDAISGISMGSPVVGDSVGVVVWGSVVVGTSVGEPV